MKTQAQKCKRLSKSWLISSMHCLLFGPNCSTFFKPCLPSDDMDSFAGHTFHTTDILYRRDQLHHRSNYTVNVTSFLESFSVSVFPNNSLRPAQQRASAIASAPSLHMFRICHSFQQLICHSFITNTRNNNLDNQHVSVNRSQILQLQQEGSLKCYY